MTGIGYRDTALRHAAARAEVCAATEHRAVTASVAAFVRGTDRRYLWPADCSEPGLRLIGGRCGCGSDIAIEVAADHPLVAELAR
jgi:hypothetical protein